MRKGQIKIIEQARRWGITEDKIEFLNQENKTLKELDMIFYILCDCNDMTTEWVRALLSVKDGSLIHLFREMKADIPISMLRENIKLNEVIDFFSTEDFPCKSLFDIKLMLSLKEKGSPYLFRYVSELHHKYCMFDPFSDHYLLQFADSVAKVTGTLKDEDIGDFLDRIFGGIKSEDDFNLCMAKDSWCYDLAKQYVKDKLPFRLTSTNDLPDDIATLVKTGYYMTVHYRGIARNVHTEPKGIFIKCVPYYGVTITEDGRIYTKDESSKEKIIIFYYNTSTFIEGRKIRNGSFIYTKVYLRDLFKAISIGHSEEDISSAKSLIDYLCQKYNTKIFMDLYNDYQLSNGLLLSLTLDEVGQYRTKQELFEKHYKIPFNGNWNKKNANLTYLILKLKSRLSDTALARAMQCKNPPEITTVGRQRYKLVFILHKAIYSEDYINYKNNISLLEDALKEEYEAKKIELLPINRTINEHNARNQRDEIRKRIKKAKVKIKKNSKFKTLIENMPQSYELINTEKRLNEEAVSQHNCVYEYADKITGDRCMIYSTVYDGKRHTIEIVKEGGRFVIRQCFQACNKRANATLLKQLRHDVTNVNRILNGDTSMIN